MTLFGRHLDLNRCQSILELIILTGLSLPSLHLLLAPGYPATHDGLFHLFRLVELDGAIQAGVLYPRLAPNLALGYDYPIFNCYPPLAVYVAELFKLTGLGYAGAIKAVAAGAILGAGWGMLLFAREVLPRAGAFLAALAYVYLPYLLLDVYVRGALAETVALPLLPLCLWALRRFAVRVDPGRVAVAGLAIAGLLLAHNVTAIAFAPVLGAYWLLTALGDRDGRSMGRIMHLGLGLGVAVLLALAVSGFYWVPALLERDFIVNSRITAGHFDFHKHFTSLGDLIQVSLAYDYSDKPAKGGQFQAGLVQVLLGAVGWLAALTRRGIRRREGIFWGCVLIGAIAVQTPYTAPVWEAVPFMSYLQYPWRLLSIVGVASSLLTGHLASTLWQRNLSTWTSYSATLALAATIIIVAVGGLASTRLPLQDAEIRPLTMQRIELIQRGIAGAAGEFLPRWMTDDLFGTRKPQVVSASDGEVRVTVREAGLFSITMDVASEHSATIFVDRFYFPGWQASADGLPVGTRPAGPMGLLAVDLPDGEHRITLRFGNTPVLRTATAATVLGLLALAVLVASPMFLRGFINNAAGNLLPEEYTVPRKGRTGRNLTATLARLPGGMASGMVLGAAIWLGADLIGITLSPGTASSQGMLAQAAADFGPAIRLAGASAGRSKEGVVDVNLFWQAKDQPDHDYVVALRLLDSSGQVVGEWNGRPLAGLRPTTLWEKGELVRDHQQIALRPGVPGGDYDLAVGLRASGAGSFLRPVGPSVVEWHDGESVGTGLRLGSVSMPRNPSPVDSALGHSPKVRFGELVVLDGFELHRLGPDGIELPQGASDLYVATVGQGERLLIKIRWSVVHDLYEGYAAFVHLTDNRQHLIAQSDKWLRKRLSLFPLWLPGDEVSDEYEVQVPEDALPGRYNLSVGLYRRSDVRRLPLPGLDGSNDRLSLGFVKVVRQPPLAVGSLALRRRLDASFGEEITLLGYDLHHSIRDRRLFLTLYWRVDRRPLHDYTVFVHLYDAQGRLQGQTDGLPLDGRYPTTFWEPGEIIEDVQMLELRPEVPDGRYQLAVGLYQPQTGARLPLLSGGDRLLLEEMTVGVEGDEPD